MSKKTLHKKSRNKKQSLNTTETKRIQVFVNKNGSYSRPIIQIAEDCTLHVSGGTSSNGARLNAVILTGSSGEYKLIGSSIMVTKGSLKVELDVTFPGASGDYSCNIEYKG